MRIYLHSYIVSVRSKRLVYSAYTECNVSSLASTVFERSPSRGRGEILNLQNLYLFTDAMQNQL